MKHTQVIWAALDGFAYDKIREAINDIEAERELLLVALADAAEALEITADYVESEHKAVTGTVLGIRNDAKKARAALKKVQHAI